ncbi:hypothetical protein BDN67DRAFT_961940 [Paxillus ammoniavirescens]|nr:hypothetical protein BDN67DRAFT_961940 [Paxillus ammoniavirescens]
MTCEHFQRGCPAYLRCLLSLHEHRVDIAGMVSASVKFQMSYKRFRHSSRVPTSRSQAIPITTTNR